MAAHSPKELDVLFEQALNAGSLEALLLFTSPTPRSPPRPVRW